MVDTDNLILCFQALISLISIGIGAALIFITEHETIGMVLITSIVGVWLPSPTSHKSTQDTPRSIENNGINRSAISTLHS